MTYQRNGRVPAKNQEPTQNTLAPSAPANAEEKIKIDGFGQVIAMLRHADPQFRQSLLKRLIKQDPHMGSSLQAALKKAEQQDN